MADVKYSGVQRGEDTRYKVNNNILRMMNANPYLGIGYLIGNAIGENYFGNKRNKSMNNADKFARNGSVGANENGVYGTENNTPRGRVYAQGTDWNEMNKALDNIPRTPQQNNQKPITLTDNGVQSVNQAWQNMANGSAYNPGNTTLFTNGVRNMGNVMPEVNSGVIVDTAKGIYPGANPGVYIDTARGIYPGGSQDTRPAAPTPYTDDQLRQIMGQNFTQEELAKMMTANERARMNALLAPAASAYAPAQVASGAPSVPQAVNNAVQATPSYVPEEMAAALDRKTMFVPEEEAGLAEAYRVANNFSRAAATPAGAANYGSRFITPGHDESLEWHPFATQASPSDVAAREMALKWLENNS